MSEEEPTPVIRGLLDQPFPDPFREQSAPEPKSNLDLLFEDAKLRETEKHRWAHGAIVVAVLAAAWFALWSAWTNARHGDGVLFGACVISLLLDGAAIMVNVMAMRDA